MRVCGSNVDIIYDCETAVEHGQGVAGQSKRWLSSSCNPTPKLLETMSVEKYSEIADDLEGFEFTIMSSCLVYKLCSSSGCQLL